MAGNKKKGGGIGKVIACLLLVVIIGLGASWGTGFALTGEANPGNWKKQNSEAVTPNTVAVTNDGQLMESGNVYNMPASGFTFLSGIRLSKPLPRPFLFIGIHSLLLSFVDHFIR